MIASLHVRSVISGISLKRSYKPSLPLWVYESKRCNLSKNSLAFKDGVYIYTCYLLLCICCIWLRSVHVQYGKTYKRWDTKINFVPFISKIKCGHLFLYFVFVFISYFFKGFSFVYFPCSSGIFVCNFHFIIRTFFNLCRNE